jgi:hypothetical protein
MNVKAVLAALAIIVGAAIKSAIEAVVGQRGMAALRQVRVIPAVEFVLLMGVSAGMSFVIVFMLGPALGEMLRSAAG